MYDVVVLVEQPISRVDARQIVGLHSDSPEPTHYHVLLPVEDATSRVEATIGSLAASEVLGTSSLYFGEDDIERIQQEIVESSREAVTACVAALREAGAHADGEVTAADPLDRLCELVRARNSAEVIVLTRPHVVAELLHVDWTSRARRRLGVPCLHLLAHRDPDGEPATN